MSTHGRKRRSKSRLARFEYIINIGHINPGRGAKKSAPHDGQFHACPVMMSIDNIKYETDRLSRVDMTYSIPSLHFQKRRPTMTRFAHALIVLTSLIPATTMGQTTSSVIEGHNGTRIVVDGHEGSRAFQARWGYAPAIQAGDLIVMSGVIAGPGPDAGTDAEAYKRGLRRAFDRLRQNLKSLDASFADVIKINTYHVFDSAYFDGDKMAHMEAVREVKQVYMGSTTPAWTAIGVSELFSDAGLVEIELTVYKPQGEPASSGPTKK